jgi:serine/threonine protein kinase
MEIGQFKSWKRAGKVFPKSGQGKTQLVTCEGDASGELYVLKTMPPEQASRPARQERFKREIEALRQFDDPHVLKIVDYGTDERGAPYLVTPYCQNGSLDNARKGSVIETLRRFLGICQGVAHAHEKNVVHRDIKPKNIFLDGKHEPIVGDFGLCFLLDDENGDDERVTETMEVAGPRWFGAPESRDGRLEDVTPAGDVYSLGKVLHSMFPGSKPFDREDHRSERNRLGKGFADRREYELVHQLLDKMIVHTPADRYGNATLAADAVGALIRILEVNGRPILIDFPHRCAFCGQGMYKFMNGPEDIYKNDAEAQGLGLQAPQHVSPAQFSHNFFMIAVCDVCSHVQFFRPDLVKGARELWMRKPQ